MFLGAIPADLQSIVSEHTRTWATKELWVGCSGNFTIERVLSGRFYLHSNDVSLYSCAIGSHFAGQPFRLDVKPQWEQEYGWLREYMANPVDRLATLLVCSQMLQGLGRHNPYFERLRRGFREQWDTVHGKTAAKLSRVELQLSDFSPVDAREYMDRAPRDHAVASFPPFDVGGYETMFAPLEAVFDWDEPDYQVMDQDGLHELLEQMQEHAYWLFGTDHRLPDLELRGIVQPTNRNRPIYVYSSEGGSRIALPHQNIEPVTVPRLGLDDELGGRMALAPLTAPQFGWVRSQYLNPSIAPGMPLAACAVLVDGKMVGSFAWLAGRFGPGAVYLMSDFPVAPTRYRRLSKLVVMAALSKEAQLLMERSMSRRVREVLTTAFTAKPTSMKYRGVLELYKRTENPPSGYPYQLEYKAKAGKWTLDVALDAWKEKYADLDQQQAA